MRIKREYLVIWFDTTAQAMAMERFCEKHGLPGRLIPVPREITAGCGLAWRVALEDSPRLKDALPEWREDRGVVLWL